MYDDAKKIGVSRVRGYDPSVVLLSEYIRTKAEQASGNGIG
jgi:hypothetical protein